MIPFVIVQLFPSLYAMPLGEATPAAGSRGVLRDKYRVAAKWRLLAVVWRLLGCKPPRGQLTRVADHFRHTMLAQIRLLACAKPETHSKIRMRQGVENGVEIAHGT